MARASWKLCSMSGLHTPSASFSRGLSSASPSSSLPPLGEGAGTHSADVVGRRREDQRSEGGGARFGRKEGKMKEGDWREQACLYDMCRCDDDGRDLSEQSCKRKTKDAKTDSGRFSNPFIQNVRQGFHKL